MLLLFFVLKSGVYVVGGDERKRKNDCELTENADSKCALGSAPPVHEYSFASTRSRSLHCLGVGLKGGACSSSMALPVVVAAVDLKAVRILSRPLKSAWGVA